MLYAAFGLILVPFGCGLLAFSRDDPSMSYVAVFYLCSPILYAFMGFIFTALGSWVYNLVARRLGVVEFTLHPEAFPQP